MKFICPVVVVALISLLVSFPGLVQSLTESQIGFLEGMITTKFLPDHEVPGMAVSFVHNTGDGDSEGNQVYAIGFGYRNLEQRLDSNNQTLFGIGSLSKMISSLFITKLLNDKFPQFGEGVLDKPIRELAPNYNLVFSDRYRTEFTTFRDLLSHKMCLHSTATNFIGSAGAFRNKSDLVYRQRYEPQGCHFRNIQISYSNTMIQVAAESAAAVHGNGTSFDDLLVGFLRSIGMSRTRPLTEDEDFDAVPNMAYPYYHRDDRVQPMNVSLLRRAGIISASGGILTTSTDMAAYISLLITKGKVGDTQVVKEEIFNWITRISTAYRFNTYKQNPSDRPSAEIGYGIGLTLAIYDNWQRIQHSGYFAPYSALMTVIPAHKFGMFTVANGPNVHPNHYHVHNQMFEVLLGNINATLDNYVSTPATAADYYPDIGLFGEPSPSSSNPQEEEFDEFNPNDENTRQINHSEVVGSYGFPPIGSINITNLNETTLYFTFGEWLRGYLIPREETPAIYDFEYDTDLPHHFYASSEDVPEGVADFSTPDIVKFTYAGQTLNFIRDYDIGTLPEIPWDRSSCGPTPTAAK